MSKLQLGPKGTLFLCAAFSSGSNLFVGVNEDLYFSPPTVNHVHIWPISDMSSHQVLPTGQPCEDIFLDENNTLYCSYSSAHEIVSKFLGDPASPLIVVAGTGYAGPASDMLNNPFGVFVDLRFDLYVADRSNDRIQRFSLGQTTATTVAGSGSSGTISLSYPRSVVLDGDGYMFIVDTNNDRIVRSGPGGFYCVAGCVSSGSGSNQLSLPLHMSFDSYGNIWVIDFNNNRVQQFTVNNSFSGRVFPYLIVPRAHMVLLQREIYLFRHQSYVEYEGTTND